MQVMEGMLKLVGMTNPTAGFIPEVLATFMDEEKLYLLLNGVIVCDLETLMHTTEKMTESQSAFYIGALALSLQHIHGAGMHYRSMYPEQILLNKDGFPVVGNFKLAKSHLGKSFTICGSPEFFAPEVINHAGADYTADWWSLGVILCEMITGSTPFSGENISELDLYENIINFQYGKETIPDASPELQDIIKNLLHPDPKKRLGVGSSGPQSGADQILNHPWIKANSISATSLLDRSATCPHGDLLSNLWNKYKNEGHSELTEDTDIPKYSGPTDWYATW
jgi:serine/threonine protein kinase